MRLFFSPEQLSHKPTQYGVHGRLVRPLENPERGETLLASLAELGLDAEAPGIDDEAPIRAVHAGHYVDFLKTAYTRFKELPNAGPEVLPNVHPYFSGAGHLGARPAPRVQGILGQTGWYMGDLACAMMAGTFAAAKASAMSAAAVAQAILDVVDTLDASARAPAAFALCRPPGHHAYRDRASGFCYFNNAAIAAEILRARFARVAILDFDTHHGDGTQAIFYERDDVFFGSTHTDPVNYYPHFFGYADERGEAAGEGFNLNLPLAPGSGDDVFVAAVDRLAEAATSFGAEALVISAGWDAHRDDPLSKLDVSTDAYRRVGERLSQLALPAAIIQEGGYSLAAVAQAAPAFIAAYRGI